jgi:superkiller protein 3
VVSIWRKPTRLCFIACLPMALQPALHAQPANGREEALAAKSHLARQALQDKRYQEAAALYRELLQALPDNVGLRLNLAIALDKAGQPSAAIPEIQRVTRATPASEPAWLLLGLAYQQLNQPANAIPPLRHALRLNPADHSALLELADAELTTGDTRGAARDFESLAAAEPELPKSWEGCGRAYLSLSEASFELLKANAPDSPYFLSLVARSRASADQFGDALSLYAKALKVQPDFPGLHAARAEIYRQTGHNDWAAIEEERESHLPRPDCARQPAACAYLAGDWKRTLSASGEPKLPVNLYWTAMACSRLAEESFKKLAAFRQSPELHAVLADFYQRMGRRLDAVAEWRKAVELSPSDRLFQARLAESLVRSRVYPEAEELLVKLVAQQPDNGEWQYLLGNLLLQLKRDDEALPHLIVATTRMPGLLPAQEALGRVYLDLGKPADAVVHLEKARPLDNGSISFALSSAYRQVGRLEDARAALLRYQSLAKKGSAAGSADSEAPITSP